MCNSHTVPISTEVFSWTRLFIDTFDNTFPVKMEARLRLSLVLSINTFEV